MKRPGDEPSDDKPS